MCSRDVRRYIALPWPDYQEYMSEDWYDEETFYDADKNVTLIPEERTKYGTKGI